MRHIRKVAKGEIEAPPLARQDAAAAAAAYNIKVRGESLWNGTFEDLTGYMRMTAATVASFMAVRETMGLGASMTVDSSVMCNIFIGGAFGASTNIQAYKQAYNRMDPSVRDVVTACASIQLGISLLVSTDRDGIEMHIRMFKTACDLLGYSDEEVARRQMERLELEGKTMEQKEIVDIMWHHGDEKLESLQQALYDVLGLTTADIDLVELRYFCRWRFACAILGVDIAFQPIKDAQNERYGRLLMAACIAERPLFLPPYYDLAVHISSEPSTFYGHDTLKVCQMGLDAAIDRGNWAELRLQCLAVRAVMAGALTMPRTEGIEEPDVSMIYFTAAQLRPYVAAAEELLERMRPWLSESSGFKDIESDLREWRKKYLSGGHENARWTPRGMSGKRTNLSTSGVLPGAGGSAGGGGSGSGRVCANCGATSDTLKLCTSCRQVRYCNSKCQKADWKAHKKACVASRKSA